jgi:ubiquinone/menaquinone biosynthesis C-methylase UbiE
MGFMNYVVSQAGKPSGIMGRFSVRLMNSGHWPVTKWGLGHIEVHPDDVILDIGCGGGKTVNRLASMTPEGKVYGIDYSEASVAVANSINKNYIADGRVKILQASAENLPFPDTLFDIVTAVQTSYFWPDLVKTLREIRRVLKRGGSLLIINEVYRDDNFEKRNSRFGNAGDFNYLLPEEYRTFFSEAGYPDIQIHVLPAKNWLTAVGVKADS